MHPDQSPAPADLAVERFQQGFSCSQAVFSVFAPQGGLPEDAALRIAAPFGGGICHCGQICGAVSGALMVLGLLRGNDQPDPDAKEHTRDLGKQVISQFTARHGSISCTGLLGADLSTPEGRQRAREEHLTAKVCPRLVRDAAEVAQAVLDSSADPAPAG